MVQKYGTILSQIANNDSLEIIIYTIHCKFCFGSIHEFYLTNLAVYGELSHVPLLILEKFKW